MTLPGAPKSPKEAVWGFKPGLATQRLEGGKGKLVHQPRAMKELFFHGPRLTEKLEEAQNDWSLEGKIQCWQVRLESYAGTRWHQLPRL